MRRTVPEQRLILISCDQGHGHGTNFKRVLLIILRKLALQDPASLLEAPCACKFFHSVFENNPEIWKIAFFGSVISQATEKSDQEEMTSEIDSIGGYKQLVRARWSKSPRRFILEQNKREVLSETKQSLGQSDEVYKYLIILKEEGILILWGLLVLNADSPFEIRGDFKFFAAIAAEGTNPKLMSYFHMSTSRLKPVPSEPDS